MRRTTPWIFALALTLALPAIAYAINLTSPGGFVFDIQDSFQGHLVNGGTTDAYDSMYFLTVNGTQYSAGGTAPTLSLGGRQTEMGTQTIGSLMVRRLVFVPGAAPGGGSGNYCRYLDLISNPTGAPIVATIMIDGGLGGATALVTGSSSGDTVVSTADDWFTTDLAGSRPSLGHVFQGSGGLVRASTVILAGDRPSWQFSVMVPAGGRVGILTFAIMEMNAAMAVAEARRVVDLPDDAVDGLLPYATDIVNFAVGGAPLVRFTAPSEIDEGAETLITISVEDLEMDPSVSWSWDTDDDGTFGELADVDNYTIPAGSTDGDSVIRVGVRATDGTLSRDVYRSITVHNVAPLITTSPPTTANVRREYAYTPAIDEPAGALDPIRYILISRPTGMTEGGGTITWTPNAEQRGRTFDVTLRVDDGDGGEDQQMWRIEVADNTPPEAPTPTFPIDRERVPVDTNVTLVVDNGTDPDGDELVYFFRVSQTSDFMGPDVLGSGELSEGAGGTTEWTTNEPLTVGLWYWEIWVDDGIAESFHRFAQVIVGDPDIPREDSGTMTGRDGGIGPGVDAGPPGGGGGCRAAPSRGTGSAWLLGLVALFFVRRRGARRAGEERGRGT